MIESFVPVLQELLATAIWQAGRSLARAARLTGNDVSDPLGTFTAQTLDSTAVIDIAGEQLELESNGMVKQDHIAKVLAVPDIPILVYELLTIRLLEQPDAEAEPLRKGLVALVQLECPDLAKGVESRLIGEAIFLALDKNCKEVVQRLDNLDPSARASIQQLAGLSSMTATLKSVERHVEVIANRLTESADEAQYLANYQNQLARRHGVLTLPDFEIERRIAVDQLYVEPTIIFESGSVYDTGSLLSQGSRIVVLGTPGGGKSTLAGVLTFRLARAQQVVPFLVVLREYGQDFADGKSILQHIERVLNTRYQSAPPPSWVESTLINGNAFIIFDGLDELLDPTRRREIKDAVEAFCDTYPFVRVLVTSRVVGYDQAPLSPSDFIVGELGELTPGNVEHYVRKWFTSAMTGLTVEEREARVSGFMRESESVQELRRNPLLLSLMCVLYRGSNYIPESRLNLYDECAKLLFKKWDRSRNIHVPLELGPDIDSALMHVALWMVTEGHTEEGVTEEDLVRKCAEYLVPRRYERLEDARRVAEEFVIFCRGRAWVLVEAGSSDAGQPLYTFTHRTFLEYYAASELTRQCGTPEAIADALFPRLAKSQWDVIGQLAIQISNRNHAEGADRVLLRLLDSSADHVGGERSSVLDFCARALQYLIPSPSLVRRITRECFALNVVSDLSHVNRKDHDPFTTETAISNAMGALPASLPVVGDELGKCVIPYLQESQSRDHSVAVGAITLVFFSRVVANAIEPEDEHYAFWGAWTKRLLADKSWIAASQLLGVHRDTAMGALETGLIDCSDFLKLFGFQDMFGNLGYPNIRLNRVATLPLAAGWLLGRYWRRVFMPGAVEHVLKTLPGAIHIVPWPVSSKEARSATLGAPAAKEDRASELPVSAWPGAVLLLCMSSDLELISEKGVDLHEVMELPDRSMGRFDLPEVYGAVVALAAELIRLRRGDSAEISLPEVAQRAWAEMPPEIEHLLTEWVAGRFDFWAVPDSKVARRPR